LQYLSGDSANGGAQGGHTVTRQMKVPHGVLFRLPVEHALEAVNSGSVKLDAAADGGLKLMGRRDLIWQVGLVTVAVGCAVKAVGLGRVRGCCGAQNGKWNYDVAPTRTSTAGVAERIAREIIWIFCSARVTKGQGRRMLRVIGGSGPRLAPILKALELQDGAPSRAH
jgi:hypothetical protein